MIKFTVWGRPRGKGRPRFSRDGRPPITPKATREAEQEIAWAFKAATKGQGLTLMTGTVELTVEAVFAIPKSWPKALQAAALIGAIEYTGKPDRDNIEKLVMDALNGVAWIDDAQVNRGPVIRRYGVPQRVEIAIIEHKAADGLKSPAEARREAKLATGNIHAARVKRPAKPAPIAFELPAIGRRIR